jgi:hypothetical protein
LFFFLKKKEQKNQESLISAAQATRHRRLSLLTRRSEFRTARWPEKVAGAEPACV